ncbi:hypothetical protein ACFQ9J_15970 [Streptomyces sp. NPDC056529]|uniref:hypothetical protein n=1 Tax=Streptomyces sp. NPDC056529 TaxID=3345855 RepID=UPI0036BE2C9D
MHPSTDSHPPAPRTPRRRRAVSLLTTLAAICASPFLAAPAQAAPLDLTCTGSQTLNYSPGLTLTPQNVTVSGGGTFTCISLADPTLTAGGFTVPPNNATLGCGLTGGSGTFTYQWNNGTTSTITATSVATVNLGAIQIISTGTVVAGQFTGDNAVFTWTGTSSELTACLTSGVSQYNGTTTLTFT